MNKFIYIFSLMILSNIVLSEQMVVVGEVFTESW